MKIENLPPLGSDSLTIWVTKIVQYWNDHDQGIKRWTKSFVGNGPSAPSGDFYSNGSFGTNTISVSTTYTIGVSDQIILANSTSSGFTITLPTAVSVNGKRYTIKDWKGQSATHNITVSTTSSQTIDGAASLVLSINYESYTIVSDGANWAII